MCRIVINAFIVLAPLLFSTLTFAADWKLVVDAGFLIYELDRESVSRQKEVVTFWSQSTVRERETYFSKYAPDETPHAVSKSQHRINCSTRTHTILQTYYYNDAGQVISSIKEVLPESAIVPDSVAGHYFKAVCRVSAKSK